MRRFPAILLLLTLFAVAEPAWSQVRVVYTVDTVNEGQYTSHVMITNMTSTPISGWEMTFRMDQHITNIEHVEWSEFQNVFTVKGQGWTNTIEPGDVVWLTLTGTAYGEDPEIPRSCFFNGTACTVELHPDADVEVADASEMIVTAWVEDYDFTTYTGFIAIQNPTDRVFPATWGLQFSTPSQIMEMDEVIWRRSGNNYAVNGHAHTDRIDAHDFVLIPFRGVHSGTPVDPVGCRLSGVACTFQPPDALVEIPDLTVFFKLGEVTEDEWEGYIRIENPTKTILSSWVLRFSMDNLITHADGMLLERDGTNYEIRPGFGRGRIMRETEYTFAIRGTYSDSLDVPSSCTLNSVRCAVRFQIQDAVDVTTDTGGSGDDGGNDGGGDDGGGDDGGGDDGGGDDGSVTCANAASGLLPEIDFRFLSVQATSYVAFLDIKNTDIAPILNWALEFRLVDGMTISTISSGTDINWQFVGGNYRIEPDASDNCILPGATVRLNVLGTHNGNFNDPIGCNFGGNICVFARMATDAEEAWYLPEDVTLAPAYPNPFNPRSTITFEVNQSQPVRVELWDALGRRQALLYDGYATAGTSHAVSIDGSRLASGMYYVRLLPEHGSVQTQTVILQK